LVSVKKAPSLGAAYDMIETTLQNRTAIKRFELMLKEQGVQQKDADYLCKKGTDKFTTLPKSKRTKKLNVETAGRFL
jgi:thymidine phosphorylase